MPASTSIRIEQSLYDEAKVEATIEHRTIAGQITCWGSVERPAVDNPNLPVSFVAEALAVLAESHERAVPFVPRSGGHDPRFHADTAFASAYKRPPGCDRNCVSHTVGLWADPYCFRRPEASQLSINVDIFFSAYPQFSMWRIDEHRPVDKRLAGFGPVEVLKRYEKWKDIARLCGPAGLRLIKGFRDEAPSGVWNGHRSCRLGLQCRAIYRVVADVLLIQVVDVNAHDYRKP